MTTGSEISDVLSGGDSRSLGRADEIAARVLERPGRLAELFERLPDEDPLVAQILSSVANRATRLLGELGNSSR